MIILFLLWPTNQCMYCGLVVLLLQGARIPAMPVVIGESGARDNGDNSFNNTDTTQYDPADRAWLDVVASYLRTLRERTGRQPSFFFWALNANSGERVCS